MPPIDNMSFEDMLALEGKYSISLGSESTRRFPSTEPTKQPASKNRRKDSQVRKSWVKASRPKSKARAR